MQQIIDFFVSIGDAISAFFRFLISIVKDIVYIVKMMVSFLGSIPDYLSWIPTEAAVVVGLLMSLLGIYVVIRVAGKE